MREYGSLNDSKITGIDKRWSDMSQSDKARALANIQRQQTESGKDTVQHYQDLAHQFGLKPTPKDQAEAAAQFADATRENTRAVGAGPAAHGRSGQGRCNDCRCSREGASRCRYGSAGIATRRIW